MKKVLLVIGLLFILYSCTKKDEVIIDTVEKEAEEEVKDVVPEDGLTSKPLVVIKPEDSVKIFVRADGAPGMYLADDGEVYGFYVDLERMIMNRMGQTYEFIPYTDVGPVALAMKTGTHHIGLSVPDLPDYRTFMNLSIHYETLNYVTFVREDNKDIKGTSKEDVIKSLHGKRVGVQVDGHIYQILRDIKEIELVEYPTTTKALADLNAGLLDAVPDVKRIGEYYSKLNNWTIKPVGEAIISHKISTGFSKIYDTSFIDKYNKALQSMLDDGSVEKLWVSYFGPITDADRP